MRFRLYRGRCVSQDSSSQFQCGSRADRRNWQKTPMLLQNVPNGLLLSYRFNFQPPGRDRCRKVGLPVPWEAAVRKTA
jgi:hypothetical protein